MTTTVTKNTLSTHSDLLLLTWGALAQSETGDAADMAGSFADRSVEVTGVFGGATVTLEGSNGGSSYFTLNDPFNVALSFTSAGLRQALEITRYVRAKVTGGDGTTNIAVNVFTKRER